MNVPLEYEVEQENENVTNYHCRVTWDEKDMPQWLDPREFTIREVYSPGMSGVGVTVTELSRIPCKTKETGLFVAEASNHIKLKERLASMHQ